MCRMSGLVLASLIVLYPESAASQQRVARSSFAPLPPAEAETVSKAVGGLLEKPANLDVVEVPITEGLAKLFRQSGVAIAYSSNIVPQDRRVTCHCERVTVGRALSIGENFAGWFFRRQGAYFHLVLVE